MAEADRLVASGLRRLTLVWAKSQTGGYGRFGRSWASPLGNLYWTLILPWQSDWPKDFGLTFASGLAVAQSLEDAGVNRSDVTLKWPNDCLLRGKKIAGILVRVGYDESSIPAFKYILVGIGVNVSTHPEDTFFPATSLAEVGLSRFPVSDLRDVLTDRFLSQLDFWKSRGLQGLYPEYRSRLYGVGRSITVAVDRERTITVNGKNIGMDLNGALMLELSDGSVRSIPAGDVLQSMS